MHIVLEGEAKLFRELIFGIEKVNIFPIVNSIHQLRDACAI